MSIVSPASQKQALRPIGFLLDEDGTIPSVDSFVELYIRPEDMSIASPSRVNVHQTIGGIWANVEGSGVRRVTISGTTGWHGNGILGTDGGLSRFKKLKSVVFDDYFKRRIDRIASGANPNDVKVVFVDRLNELCFEVVPINFNMKRSKSRPLLIQYQITLDVINPDASEAYVKEFEASVKFGDIKALGSLGESIGAIGKFAEEMTLSSGLDCASELIKYGTTSYVVFNKVKDAYKSGGIISAGMSALSVGMSSFGANALQELCTTLGLPENTLASLMKGASAFGNIYCLFQNAFNSGLNISDYTKLQGASFCSSTAGGAPISDIIANDLNGFIEVFGGSTTDSGVFGVTSTAMNVLQSGGLGKNIADVASSLRAVNSGIDLTKLA